MSAQEISRRLLSRYEKVPVVTVFGVLRDQGYASCYMLGVEPYTPGSKLVGLARTLRFIPRRPDITAEVQRGEGSPQYEAMGACGPGDVLVCDAMGIAHANIGGDVTLLHLRLVKAEGVVTDGGIIDFEGVAAYGFKIFAGGRRPMGGTREIDAYEVGGTVQCGGAAVRQGDVIVGDDDGVVVVPRQMAADVIEQSEEREGLEAHIKDLIQKENVPSGKYYPAPEEVVRRYRLSRGGKTHRPPS